MDVNYLVEVREITTISSWRQWIIYFRISDNGSGTFTLNLPLDAKFHYSSVHTLSIFLGEMYCDINLANLISAYRCSVATEPNVYV